jgi:hypothetical protein
MLSAIDDKWVQGEYLNFKDEGPVSPGRPTRRFSVTSRQGGALLGYVKWFNHWRKYCFYSVEAIFDAKCLGDIKEFLELATALYREIGATPARNLQRSRT